MNAEADRARLSAASRVVPGMKLDFGIFDHLDRNDLALHDLYEQRLLAKLAARPSFRRSTLFVVSA